ncbi:MAG: hypothetical protein K2X81_01630 [Candidatus Obscuribacterales bacterium]|nr:hypothetical protein [Candidatus Obscuribacterales bacterium]
MKINAEAQEKLEAKIFFPNATSEASAMAMASRIPGFSPAHAYKAQTQSYGPDFKVWAVCGYVNKPLDSDLSERLSMRFWVEYGSEWYEYNPGGG